MARKPRGENTDQMLLGLGQRPPPAAAVVAKPARVRVDLQELAAEAVQAGRIVTLDTVDFSDENRPPTCIEVDFPILPINQIAVLEGNAGKPIYQVSKWWARRRPSVFRSMLLAAATKAPDDRTKAAKLVWDHYYANHQSNPGFAKLQVADVFMGGGTTIVEGSRLGMKMHGVDYNPVAWFIVRNEVTPIHEPEVEALLAAIKAEVHPQIMPFYACDCPRGHRGTWTHQPSGKVMGSDFNALTLTPAERKDYTYDGPEIIYVFWAKHAPCQRLGCGHRTPLLKTPIIATKTLSVTAWKHTCEKCHLDYDIEKQETRIAPRQPLYVVPDQRPYAIWQGNDGVVCPRCNHREVRNPTDGERKTIELTLLAHPEWLAGAPSRSEEGEDFGGRVGDDPASTARWESERARTLRLLEVRGPLPEQVTCPVTNVTFYTDERGGNVPQRSTFTCRACGQAQDNLTSIKATGRSGPVSAYAIQGFCPECKEEGHSYNGRFFARPKADALRVAHDEWWARRDGDLAAWWPRSELPEGLMTTVLNGGIPNHGFTHWWTMFNTRQLLVLTQLFRAIETVGAVSRDTRDHVLGAFQQYLRNQNMFSIWDISRDCMAPMLSNANYHPKATMVENCVFGNLGRGNWSSCAEALAETAQWMRDPWEHVPAEIVERHAQQKGVKLPRAPGNQRALSGDSVRSAAALRGGSATELTFFPDASLDLVITDPPFAGLLHYSELADFFYVWLRLPLRVRFPELFDAEYTPKTLEAVSNRARAPEDPDGFYNQLLTAAWAECHRVLKASGLLAFTFHHDEDEPWVGVLESLFKSGFELVAAYPIRSDETKGEGAKPGTFGSQKVEFDIIHVCRKRREEPQRISWARLRRLILEDVRQIEGLIELHAKQGLPDSDRQVIRRGKALVHFSKHYGQVFAGEEREVTVKEALAGIAEMLNEDIGPTADPPPTHAEPMTRLFLRLFGAAGILSRNDLQKYLRGSGQAPSDFEGFGWCQEVQKVYYQTAPIDFAKRWHQRTKSRLVRDYDQAMVLIGGCVAESGINVEGVLDNKTFSPHPALKGLLEWHARGADDVVRGAAQRALVLFAQWERANEKKVAQLKLFEI
jgi:hypothetical protein